VPDIELGSDWIVGFPGESESDYRASEELLADQGFATNYVFKYDPRPGTSAHSGLADDVIEDEKRERNQRLLAKSEETALKALSKHVGTVRRAFVESISDRNPASLLGRTEHQLPVSFAGPAEIVGRIVSLRIEGASPFGLAASLV
jgi:tRNA-2-methylthio-N6-dimethylallyladenosine synthase